MSCAPTIPFNNHSIITRSKASVFKPSVLLSSVSYPNILFEPKSYKEALKISKWKNAMQLDIDALIFNDT